ncbi:MAG TPA: hypothetical protein ENO25_06440 [Desulfobacteraceae bacterium]|nr:hypothetical protein [Desulfobacteraceae bacterium]
MLIATTVMFSRFLGTTDTVKHVSILLLVYVLSYLMVSNHRYLSFKHVDIKKGKRFQIVVFMLLFLILLATEPPITLFIVALAYVLSGPVLAVYSLISRRHRVTSKKEIS